MEKLVFLPEPLRPYPNEDPNLNYPRTGFVKTLLQAQIRQSDQPQDEVATLRQMAMILEAAPQLAAEAGYDKKQ